MSEVDRSRVEVPRTTRVKICGITSIEDGLMVARLGADALGLVFYEPSPRCVTIEQARSIAMAVGPLVNTVGLFVNAETDVVNQVLSRVPLNLLQFHGDEDESFCRQFNRPYMKALRMRSGLDVTDAIESYTSAVGILLDAYKPNIPGGTGEVFDWQRVPNESAVPLVLAGGLTPSNVAEAISSTANIHGVDVSGGVEASPGIKDYKKVSMFIGNAKVKNNPLENICE